MARRTLPRISPVDARRTRSHASVQPVSRRHARSHRRGRGGRGVMSSLALFEQGTPDEGGAALAVYRRETAALAGEGVLRWYVDPGNIGLLSRAVRELDPACRVDVV